MPLNCIFWCISFGRQFITRPVIWKKINGRWRWGVFLWLFPLSYFYFFMNAGGYIAGGLTSSIKGQHFPLNYVSLWQSLCFWSVITVIYSCGFPLKGFPLCLFPEWNLWLFAATTWCFPSPALCLQTANTNFSTLHVVGIFVLKLLLSNKTD